MNQISTRSTTASSTNIETSNLNNSDNILDSNIFSTLDLRMSHFQSTQN